MPHLSTSPKVPTPRRAGYNPGMENLLLAEAVNLGGLRELLTAAGVVVGVVVVTVAVGVIVVSVALGVLIFRWLWNYLRRPEPSESPFKNP